MGSFGRLSLFAILSSCASLVVSQLTSSAFTSYPDVLEIPTTFDPIIAAYWTGLPHHRRTPFALSPDGSTAYLAFLSTTYDSVIVQPVDPTSFTAVGTSVEIPKAREVSGLVAQDDGFAVLVNIDTADVDYPVATIIRYKDGSKAWETAVNGPGVHESEGLSASPDMNGDLVYSEKAGMYAAYFVVAAYSGDASGHYGDSIQYVDDSGTRQTITGASSTFGCSHNTGIAFESADEAPFASICAEDHGAIWLNTETQYMSGVKIANENTTNGVSGEPMGGMSGSYSSLSRFLETESYIFAWASRGAVDLTQDTWMGDGYTAASPRWLNHNVAISILATKSTLAGQEATSEVGASVGDSQVTWITESDSVDHQNIHVAAFNGDYALVTYETLENPDCQPVPLSCTGTFAGTYMQLVDSNGTMIGDPVVSQDTYVAGDMVNIGTKVCWPYVDMEWDLSAPKANGTYVSKLSFACMDLQATASASESSTAPTTLATSKTAASSTSVVSTAVPTTVAEEDTASSPTSITISTVSTSASAVPTTKATRDTSPNGIVTATTWITRTTTARTTVTVGSTPEHSGRPSFRQRNQRRHYRA